MSNATLVVFVLILSAGMTWILGWRTRGKVHGGALWSVFAACLWSLPVLLAIGLVASRAVPALRANAAVPWQLGFDPHRSGYDLYGSVRAGERGAVRVTLYAANYVGVKATALETHTDPRGRFKFHVPMSLCRDGSLESFLVCADRGRPVLPADVRLELKGPQAGELRYVPVGDGLRVTISPRPLAPSQVATVSERVAGDESAAPLPPEVRAWTDSISNDAPRAVIVSSGEHPTAWEAEQDAAAQARAVLRASLFGDGAEVTTPIAGSAAVLAAPRAGERPALRPKCLFTGATAAMRDIPPDVLEQAIVRRHHEQIEHATDRHTFTMHRVHLQVAATDAVRGELYRQWRHEVRNRRLWTLGGLTGMAVLLLGTCATYLRLDRATRGRHRAALKLAAVTLITTAGLAVAGCLPM